MKHKFIVTIEGQGFLYNGRPATKTHVQKMLREAVREQFDFLAPKSSVKTISSAAIDAAIATAPSAPAEPPQALSDELIWGIAVSIREMEWQDRPYPIILARLRDLLTQKGQP